MDRDGARRDIAELGARGVALHARDAGGSAAEPGVGGGLAARRVVASYSSVVNGAVQLLSSIGSGIFAFQFT